MFYCSYVIISMFFDSEEVPRDSPLALTSTADGVPTPGRMSQDVMGRGFQDEFEWGPKVRWRMEACLGGETWMRR